MVDLVKIRKKSKDAKEQASEAMLLQAHAAPEPAAATPLAESASQPVPLQTEVVLAEPEGPTEPVVVSAPPPTAAVTAKKQTKSAPIEQAAEAPLEEPAPDLAIPAAAEAADEEVFDEDRLSRFKRLAGKRRSWGAVAKPSEQGDVAAPAADLELLRFRVAGEDYAVDIDKIVEIVPPRSTTRVPNAEDSIVGIMSLRGTIVTVIDLRRKLGHPRVDLSTLKDARMIVVERAGETAGFLVDRVSRVVKLDRAQIENHPVVSSQEQSEFVSGVFQAQDGLVILLDIERILAG